MVLGDGGWETTEPVRTQPEAPPRHRCDQWHMTQLCSQTGYILALMLHYATRSATNSCVCLGQCDQWPMAYDTRSKGDMVPGAANDKSQGCPEALLPCI